MNPSSARTISHLYEDPLTVIWISCAHRLGFAVDRTREMYAGYDGQGTLFIGSDELLDPDDCLAQMIFHELCHALVEGEPGRQKVDWGLDNTRPGNGWREHACLRTQAWISGQYGLRDFMAPTTEYRTHFWSQLATDPLAPVADSSPRAITASRKAIRRFHEKPWLAPLEDALEQTVALAALLQSVEARTTSDRLSASLWDAVKSRPEPHPIGYRLQIDPSQGESCATCAWSFDKGPAVGCRRAPRRRLAPTSPACSHFEAKARVDCSTCGACCREAYDTVDIHPKEAVLERHPDLIDARDGRYRMRRRDGRCLALTQLTPDQAGYRCAIYQDRPKTCREFEFRGSHCLSARQRLGLSL